TRPEGLGGSRDAGPAVAGPRPPRRLRHGYAVQRLRPYGPYGPYEGRNSVVFPPPKLVTETGGLSGDEGPAPADLATFFFLPTAGESTANSTLFFFDLCGRYGYGYGYGKRPRCYDPSTASSFPLERFFPPDFFGCFFRPLVFRPFLPSLFFLRPALRPTETTGSGGIQQFLDQFEERVLDRRVDWLPFFVAPPCLRQIQVLTEDLPWPAAKTALLRYYGAFNQIRTVGFYDKLRRHEARRPKTKDTIDWLEKHAFLCRKLRRHEARRPKTKDTIDWLEKHAFFCRKVGPSPGPDESTEHSYGLFQALPKEIQGLGGSRDAGPAVAGPRPPYVTEAVRHSGCGYGTATPYSGYGRTGRTGRTREGT
ncbi:hypothetical protein L249_7601, partial [Ophiocordyceps polyrhachis-furcata BCC 54312]